MPIVFTVDKKAYTQKLAGLISERVISKGERVLFLDCMNRIDQYMFRRDEVEAIMDRVFLARLETFFDFYDCLRNILKEQGFWNNDVLIISPFSHLMEDLREEEKKHYNRKISETLVRIERYRPVFTIC